MSQEQDLESAEELAAIHAFHELYARDAEAGNIRPRAAYEGLFPEHGSAIAKEYALVAATAGEGELRAGGSEPNFLGPYRLIRELGRGGQGIVWLAEDSRLHRRVALKVLSPGLGLSTESMRRFQREAEIASRIEHPGIGPVHELGQAHGVPYIAMRYVEGETLANLIAKERESQLSAVKPEAGRTPPIGGREAALRRIFLIEKVALAVHAAHEAGVLHRDLKPGNIMVAAGDEPVILDFGLARWMEGGHSQLTRSGDVFGTPPYMAPEQLREGGGRADRRTDVYALGATLYESLTLRRPFEAPTCEETYHRILTADPTYPPGIFRRLPRDLVVVLATALEKNPDRRYQTALDFAEDLRRVQKKEPIRARAAGPWLRTRRWVERNRVLTAAMLAVFLLLSAGLGLSLVLLHRVREGYDRARAVGLVSASMNEMGRDQMLGLLLASEAVRTSPDPMTRSQLRNALAVTRERAIMTVGGLVNLARWSPDGTRIVAGSRQAFVWDTAEAQPITLATGGHAILQVEFSRDGEHIATLSDDFGAVLWGFDAGKMVHLEHLPAAQGLGLGGARWQKLLCFSPAEDLLFVGQESGSVLAFDLRGEKRRTYNLGNASRVVAVACSPRGNLLAFGGEDGSLRVVPVDGSDAGTVLSGHVARITCLEFSPDGGKIATGSMDGTARLWSAIGTPLATIQHGGWVTSVAFAPDGESIVTAFEDQTGRRWSLSGELLQTYQGHVGALTGICFSPDGSRVLTCANDATARLFSLEGREVAVLRGHEERVTMAAFSLAGDRVVTTSWDGTVRLWDVQVEGFPTFHGHSHAVYSGAWSHAGDRIATGGIDRTLMLWDLAGRGRVVARYRAPEKDVAFTPDDRKLLAGTRDGSLDLHDLDSGQVTSWDLKTEINDVSFSRTGEQILVATRDAGLRILDEHGELLHGCENGVQFLAAAFSPDGHRVIGARVDGFPLLWTPESGELRTLGTDGDGHSGVVWDVAFAPSGKTMATCSADGTARLWDLDGRLLKVLRHEGRVNRVAFSPDGRHLATTEMGGTARIWSLDGREVATIRAASAIAWDVEFSPVGTRLLVTYSDWTARVWPVSDETVLDLARRRITRTFTPGECARYAGLLELR